MMEASNQWRVIGLFTRARPMDEPMMLMVEGIGMILLDISRAFKGLSR